MIDIYGKVIRDGALIELLGGRVSVSYVNTFMDKAMKLERGRSVKALLAFRIDDEAYDRAKELDVMLIQR